VTDRPLDEIPEGLDAELIERLARSVHDAWLESRRTDGWRWGPRRNDLRREHPDLLPYDELGDAEREIDRRTVRVTLSALAKAGYRVVRDRS
jgi:hypothetical protein